MDRTTLTAKLKPLERRGLVIIKADEQDRRGRRLHLTEEGRRVLATALPIWRTAHAALEADLPGSPQSAATLRSLLQALADGK